MKTSYIFLGVLTCAQVFAQPIQILPETFGQNASLTQTVGINSNAGGYLDNYWDPTQPTQNYIQASQVKFMRYDGNQVEKYCLIDGSPTQGPVNPSNLYLTIQDYILKAKAMRNNGIEPMLALPLKIDPVNGPLFSFTDAASHAALLVKGVNDGLVSMQKTPVKIWIYSNEPEGSNHNFTNANAAQNIHSYIYEYYTQVTNTWSANCGAWGLTPTDLKFVGPELWDFDDYGTNNVVNQLCDCVNYPTTCILDYLSVFTFHYYPFANQGTQMTNSNGPNYDLSGGYFLQATRQNVVDVLRQPITWAKASNGQNTPLLTNLDKLIAPMTAPTPGIITKYNNTHAHQVQVAITEANLCYKNDVDQSSGVSDAMDLTATGTSANGWLAGSFWADLMSLCMEKQIGLNFWSSIEGCGGSNCTPGVDDLYRTDIGFLSGQTATIGNRKSSYYHFQMVAENFKGNFYPSTSVSVANVKAFACVDPTGASPVYKIMLINQNNTPASYDFRINVDGNTGTTPGFITINFNLTGDPALNNSVSSPTYYSPTGTNAKPLLANSTVLLTFDCFGSLVSRLEYGINDVAPHLRQLGTTDLDPLNVTCNQPGIGGTINTNTSYSNATVFVSSDILLAANTNLTFDNCKVILAPNVQIKGTPMSSLDIKNNTTMYGCDGEQWEGINMIGNFHNGERLHIENSYLLNAKHPIKTENIPDLNISGNVIANGETAIELTRSEAFTIEKNLIGGFTTGIKTSNTIPNFISAIKENRIIDVATGADFSGDGHNMLDILCNEVRFKNKGVQSRNTDLKIQGDNTTSAGNLFVNTSAVTPQNYVDHTGNATKYFYGPTETPAFNFPNVMNIPKVQAAMDRVCATTFSSTCGSIGVHAIATTSPDFSIYPNPGTGAFTVNFSNLPKGNWTLNVQDVLGRIIFSKKLNGATESLQLNSKGIYFVSIQNEVTRSTQKVIVE